MAMRVSKKRFRECGSGALAFGVPPAGNSAGLPPSQASEAPALGPRRGRVGASCEQPLGAPEHAEQSLAMGVPSRQPVPTTSSPTPPAPPPQGSPASTSTSKPPIQGLHPRAQSAEQGVTEGGSADPTGDVPPLGNSRRERGSVISSFLSGSSGARGTPRGAGSREKKEGAGGSHLPKAEPESAAARERAAPLSAAAAPARSAPPVPAPARGELPRAPGQPGARLGSGCLSGPGPGPRRPALRRDSAPSWAPPPALRAPTCCGGGRAGEPGLGRQGAAASPALPAPSSRKPGGRSAALFRGGARAV
ncbi:atherin-like [Cervus elaphus]|uniref:atherin-like n=1 Tax=Cervus elaphus TaxID=9860 RepID=UPI001CC3203E|nr:atherin-like [Cervus elaphus]